MASETERAALAYLACGWSVVVEPRGKRPLVRWEAHQRGPPGEGELHAWLVRHPEANLAIVTGAVSASMTWIDVEDHEAASWEPDEIATDLRALGLRVDRCEEVVRPVEVEGGIREVIDVLVEAGRDAPAPLRRSGSSRPEA
jgi:hypothetical protein